MNLDQALYKTIIDSGDKLTTSKMMSVLFFNLGNDILVGYTITIKK